MLQYQTGYLVKKLMALTTSTTLFLEALKGSRLKVDIVSQSEKFIAPHQVIERIVKLFFDVPDLPVLYCVSVINREQLTAAEYQSLVADVLPIGYVFHHFNEGGGIQKRHVVISREVNTVLAEWLQVKSDLVYRKKYDYWVGERKIGHISEYFNEESLSRV